MHLEIAQGLARVGVQLGTLIFRNTERFVYLIGGLAQAGHHLGISYEFTDQPVQLNGRAS
ncbi:hypothetical protein LXM60_14135 [Pandoraea sputorum]|uniref:hypothetical protein n=1 Tax=Pandoraea sputorum TaxID=93222 RepID=UPI001E28A658|nr:hypothetical protein [Pandoraea sputorum]MCE4061344.1 hypothetical protein [Pandoraea sputorum]